MLSKSCCEMEAPLPPSNDVVPAPNIGTHTSFQNSNSLIPSTVNPST